nr:MAG TPA: hypothetical protein [Caudoviricetes sp.]
MPKHTQHKLDYNTQYNKENYAQLAIRTRPENIAAIKDAAKAAGKNITQYILDCCIKNLDKP